MVFNRVSPKIKFLLKVTTTFALLAFALYLTDISNLETIAVTVEWPWLLLSFFLLLLIVLLEALQFSTVASVFGHRIPTLASIHLTIVGRFFSIFTPAMLGGDLYRASIMMGWGSNLRSSVSIAVIFRIMSLVALVPVLVAGLPVIVWYTGLTIQVLGFFIVVAAATSVSAAILFAPNSPRLKQVRVLGGLFQGAADFRLVALHAPSATAVWLYAILQHLIRVFSITAVGHAYNLDVGLLVFFAFVPVSLLVAMVPISLGSWGLREISLVYSLGLVGVPPSAALIVSVTFGVIGTVLALIGGIFLLLPPNPRLTWKS